MGQPAQIGTKDFYLIHAKSNAYVYHTTIEEKVIKLTEERNLLGRFLISLQAQARRTLVPKLN